MRRRVFLASAGIAALAGCSSGTGSNDGTATPTSASTQTQTGDPNFEIRGTRFPGSKTLNVATTFVIAIENTGTGAGTFTSELDMRVGDGQWETAGEIEMDIPAGETAEWHSPEFLPQYLTTLHFRLSEFDQTWSIEITPRELDFGNYYAVPNGLYINVLGGAFESAYPTSDESTNSTATATATATATPTPTATPTQAPDGETWAVISLDVRNRLQEPLTAPPASSFDLKVGGESRPQHQEVAENPYEGGELAGRTVRRGELVYAVPEGTQVRDLSVVWDKSFPEGDVKCTWTK
ncbi:DUF4352 domain-containing protein [Haloplanus sp. C73]|uniref:DUF4352 domain-containing protein n=1 Tax=Haloplanus sp. C73 TaxID=3421641 RepID=UPI003EB6B919